MCWRQFPGSFGTYVVICIYSRMVCRSDIVSHISLVFSNRVFANEQGIISRKHTRDSATAINALLC